MVAILRLNGTTPMEVRPIEGALGAEVLGIDLKLLDDETFLGLLRAWRENVLLVFRDQSLQPDDIVSIARRFGTPVTSSKMHQHKSDERVANELYKLPREITAISNLKEGGKAVGALGDAEVTWHSDFSYNERPTAARMLFAVEIPPEPFQVDTAFTNCYAAFDELSNAMKREISGQTIKQNNTYDATMKLREGADGQEDFRRSTGPSHPIISTHPETDSNSIFLGRRHRAYVNGMPVQDSEALLDELWSHTTQPRFQYVHRWSAGDFVVWDNRCTLHRRDAIDPSTRRLLYAAQVKGHRPYEAADSLCHAPHPRFCLFASG